MINFDGPANVPIHVPGQFILNGSAVELSELIQKLELTTGELKDVMSLKVGEVIRFTNHNSVAQELSRVA